MSSVSLESPHLPYSELESRLLALPAPPRDEGRVVMVVIRPGVGERITPDRAHLTPESGVEGDRYSAVPGASPEGQITVMRADVARLVANGQPIEISGDNLMVDLDLSAENLPAGTRLRVGTALCEVSPKPHTGCQKFAARFGHDALRLTAAPEHREGHLRGIYLRVVAKGEVSPGDPIRVLSRP